IPPDPFDRPLILRTFSIDSPLRIYYLGLVVALTVAWLLRGVRRSRVGRVLVALRDNETNVAAFGISPTRAKLTAFAVSGAVAAVAGVVLVLAQSAFRPATYAAEESISVFVATVIGGPATLLGGVLGAVFQRGAQWLLPSPWSFLATGAGVLVVLLALPGGLAAPLWATRDRFLRWAAERHHLRPSVMVQSDHVDASGVAPAAAESAAPPLLRISDLHVGYDGVPVLSGLHLDVPAGEVVALLGTNGAGKSTLVRAIAGLVPITSGRVWFGGADITEMPPDRIAALGLGQMPGGHGVFPTLTVAENLSVATWLVDAQAEDVGRRIADSLDAFPELADRLAEPAADLSGGQQQMLALAMALIARPELLIIDELSLGLAPTVVGRLSVLVGEVAAAGTTIILVEQSINVALSLATTAVFMERGQIRFAGPARELGERPDLLRAVFLDGGEPAMRSDRRPVALDDTPALEVDAAKRRFGGIVAVDDVSFRVQRSEIVGLIGQNGAGKTTLIDMISGVQPLDGGWARLNGRDLGSLRPSARFRNGLGRTFQGGRLFPGLIVSDAIAVALEHAVEVRDPFNAALRLPPAAESEAAVVRRVEELLEVFGIEEYRDTFTAELSTGTRRIVELACAVAHQPEVLLLDEPAAGVAQREVEELGNLLLRIRDELGCAMVVVEHDVPLLARIADRLVALESGRVIAEGDPASVLADAAVVRSYLGDVAVAAQRSGPFSGNVQGGSGHAGT
ncbi:MAG: ATP-binding cassette domain-containing protein, partial [Actinomycetes bacterium]